MSWPQSPDHASGPHVDHSAHGGQPHNGYEGYGAYGGHRDEHGTQGQYGGGTRTEYGGGTQRFDAQREFDAQQPYAGQGYHDGTQEYHEYTAQNQYSSGYAGYGGHRDEHGYPGAGGDGYAPLPPPRQAGAAPEGRPSLWTAIKQRATSTSPRTRRFALLGLAGGIAAVVAERLLTGSPSQATPMNSAAGNASPMPTAAGPSGAAMNGMDGTNPAEGGATPTVLTKVSQIAVGSAKIFPQHKVVVTRPNAHTVKAFSAVCTHQGCVVNKVVKGKIHCPCHAGVFNLDGTVASGPPPKPLPAAPNVHVQDGKIIMTM